MSERQTLSPSASRPQRWEHAAQAAAEAFAQLQSALEELIGLQQEYGEWKDTLSEKNQENTPTYEKLDAVCDINIEGCLSDMEQVVGEVDSVELPRGFGRD